MTFLRKRSQAQREQISQARASQMSEIFEMAEGKDFALKKTAQFVSSWPPSDFKENLQTSNADKLVLEGEFPYKPQRFNHGTNHPWQQYVGKENHRLPLRQLNQRVQKSEGMYCIPKSLESSFDKGSLEHFFPLCYNSESENSRFQGQKRRPLQTVNIENAQTLPSIC